MATLSELMDRAGQSVKPSLDRLQNWWRNQLSEEQRAALLGSVAGGGLGAGVGYVAGRPSGVGGESALAGLLGGAAFGGGAGYLGSDWFKGQRGGKKDPEANPGQPASTTATPTRSTPLIGSGGIRYGLIGGATAVGATAGGYFGPKAVSAIAPSAANAAHKMGIPSNTRAVRLIRSLKATPYVTGTLAAAAAAEGMRRATR